MREPGEEGIAAGDETAIVILIESGKLDILKTRPNPRYGRRTKQDLSWVKILRSV